MSSSDGWPLTGPNVERQARAVDVRPEHEGEQEQADADRRPGVLVAAQPAIRADDDRERRATIATAEDQPDELDLGEPELRPEERLDDEVLRQPLHQQQGDAAEQRRRPAAGSGPSAGRPAPGPQVRAEQGREVDGEATAVGEAESVRRRSPRATRCRRPARARRARAGAPPATAAAAGSGRGSAGGQARAGRPRGPAVIAVASGSGRSSRIRTWPTWISSPKPSGATPSTRRPFTYVPFVLSRSSTYQARPR